MVLFKDLEGDSSGILEDMLIHSIFNYAVPSANVNTVEWG
jgi:hypothetical protein